MERERELIVIEGLDGSGKATQAARLADKLRERGRAVEQISFPDYDSQSSALVKMYLAGEIGDVDEVNAYAASGFYAADRYISYMRRWKKPYEAGHTIIADRYTTSNAAHQMAKLPEIEWDRYLDWLYDSEFTRMALPRPDLVVYLDLPPAASRRLLEKRYAGDSGRQDIHERNLAYLLRCREAARHAAARLGWRVLNCCRGDEVLPVETVGAMVLEEVDRLERMK